MPEHLDGIGYFAAPNWIVEGNSDLRPRERLVLCNLIRRAGPDGYCFPSIAKIAKDLGLSSRTVSYAIKSLSRKKIIEKLNRKKDDGSLDSSVYRIDLSSFHNEKSIRSKEKLRLYCFIFKAKNIIKIGVTKNINIRLKQIESLIGCKCDDIMEIHGSRSDEKYLKQNIISYNNYGEFYEINALDTIKKFFADLKERLENDLG